MNNVKHFKGLSKSEENLEKTRTNVMKIVQTRFKQLPEGVIQAIHSIDDLSILEKLFTNSIIVADFEDFEKILRGVISRK